MAKKVAKKTTRKKATKKAPVKKTAAKAGAKRPSFKISGAANAGLVQTGGLFYKHEPNTTVMACVIPRMDPEGLENGLIWNTQSLHYGPDNAKFKNPDNPERTIAPGCLQEHGDGDCYICNVADWLKQNDDFRLKALGEQLAPSQQIFCQVWIFDQTKKEWYGPRLYKSGGCSKTIYKGINSLLNMAEQMGSAPFCDPDNGQPIALIREGSTMNDTRYSVQQTGQPMPYDKMDPDWLSKAITDVDAKLDLRVMDINEQKQLLFQTLPDLPWEDIEREVG